MSDPDRRQFLEAVVWIGGGGVALALGLPGAAYLLTPVLREEERTWVDLGEVAALRAANAPLAVRFRYEGWRGYVRGSKPGLLWVVADASAPEGVVALSAVCTHKACNVAWSPEEELFACPCHSGRFDVGGAAVSGPPTAPLERVAVEVRDGHLFAELAESQA